MPARQPSSGPAARFIALVLLSLIACGKDDGATGVASQLVEDPPITISVVDPDTATIDTAITVRIVGSGFTDGSTATWLIDTTAAPGIRTVSTTWKSSTELEALITISPDAELRSYSIRIRGKKGKQGIAVERFRVVAKPIPLPEPGVQSAALDVNDSGVIVGSVGDASGASFAIRWAAVDTGWNYTILGPGRAVAVNNEGLIVRTKNYAPWTQSWRSWIHFPSGVEVDLGPVQVKALSANGTMAGFIFGASYPGTAVAWKRLSATVWGAPQALPLPAGYGGAEPHDINAAGDVIGTVNTDSSYVGVVWRYRDGQWQMPELVDHQLEAGAAAINDAGALAGWVWPCVRHVFNCYSSPAFWPSLGGSRRILPTLYNSRGSVSDMNNANQVVGSAYVHYNDGSGPLPVLMEHAVIWFADSQWPEDLGAIRPWETGSAAAINERGLVVGSVRETERWPYPVHATAWQLPGSLTTATPLRLPRP